MPTYVVEMLEIMQCHVYEPQNCYTVDTIKLKCKRIGSDVSAPLSSTCMGLALSANHMVPVWVSMCVNQITSNSSRIYKSRRDAFKIRSHLVSIPHYEHVVHCRQSLHHHWRCIRNGPSRCKTIAQPGCTPGHM